jgi:NAD+ kinase
MKIMMDILGGSTQGPLNLVKRIGLVVKNDQLAIRKADELEIWLKSRDIDVFRKEMFSTTSAVSGSRFSHAPNDLYCVLVLGGDGTFLSAVRWIGDAPIPVLGVKFGEVGFLAEISEDNLFEAAAAIIHQDFATSPRMRLRADVLREDQRIASETVLNDIVINKGALARLASIRTLLDNHYLTTYRADGLIVATPTGSTAYSLAAGGPIVHPTVPGIILTPICPFTLTIRPLIIPDSVVITIDLEKEASDVLVTFDGQSGIELHKNDMIRIQKSPYPVRMISLPGQRYFDLVKSKLRWSGGRV